MAPTLAATFIIVVVLLSAYEFGISSSLKDLGGIESFLSIMTSAVIAIIPTYLALRKQRTLQRRTLSALSKLENAEAVLEESERRFREMLENVDLVALTLDMNGIITFCNNHMLRLTGWTRDEVLGRDYFSIFVPNSNPARKKVFIENVRSGVVAPHLENQIITKNGDLKDIVWSNTMLRNGIGSSVGTASIGDDVTAAKQAERRLRLQYSVTAVLAESAPLNETLLKILERLCTGLKWDMGVIWTVDRAAKVLRCAAIWHPPSTEFNDFAADNRKRILVNGQDLPGQVWTSGQAAWRSDIAIDLSYERQVSGALGMHGWIGIPIVLPKQVLGVLEIFSAEIQAADPEMLASLAAVGMQIGQYIERRQLEEQYRQAQKMEAIGTLSGGIAHDFNNIIGAIIGFTELAKMDLNGNPVVAEHLDDVLLGANRAADLVRQILAFSRQHEQERKPIQLRHVVTEALKLLRATIPAPIEFEVSIAKDVATVLADATQVHQIVMNLATNAAHAMKDRMGRLGVVLENYDVTPDGVEAHPGLPTGRYVRLSISDTGCGMNEQTVSRIFEPFFTTKAPGEGTGLGLAVVQGIMQSHEGAVTVYSHLGEGTTFHLYFPVSGAEEIEAEIETVSVPRGAGESILYVDDELPLARMGQKVLEHLGYSVEMFTLPLEALEAVKRDPQRFSLVITDHMMPRLTGLDLASQLLAIRPNIPIILMTGYTATLTVERVHKMGLRDLLIKPISVANLAASVERIFSNVRTA
jgi:PAS domain S-box-containing protein